MSPDFEMLGVLRRHAVPFVVVGGHAVNVHGYRRATEDVDVVWLRTPESEQSLLKALTELEARFIGSDIDPRTQLERTYAVTAGWISITHLMMLSTKHGFLDLFDFVPGLPNEDAVQLLETSVDVEGLRFARLDWLRRMKTAAGRPQDLLDLKNLPE